MCVSARVSGVPQVPRSKETPSIGRRLRWDCTSRPPRVFVAHRASLVELCCGEVVMKERLAACAILAGGIALTAAAFFASADVTHWVMGLHHTDVVVRPGPTVYLTRPAGQHHARHRALPARAAAMPANSGDLPSRQDAYARPDRRGAHARPCRRGGHARPGHGGRRSHGRDVAHHRGGDGDSRGSCHRLAHSLRALFNGRVPWWIPLGAGWSAFDALSS
jgi:hypothetical protein